MALSYVEYTASGSTNQFDITFDYIDRTHVKVYVDNVEDTSFTFINDSRVQTSTTPSNGAIVKIDRDTPTDARLVDFQDGSVLTETDLDKSANQNFFIAQETEDEVASKLGQNNAGVFDALNKRIINLANPTADQDAATKHYLENTWLSASDKATITSLNSNISNINAVNSNESNINTVAGAETNINSVASNIASVNTVASNITEVVAVANDLAEAVSEVETVANDLNEATSEIDTVATNINSVNTVGNNISDINTVAAIDANISTVANNDTDISSVANISSDVTSVANISGNVTSVANISSDVSSLANSLQKTYVVTVVNVGGTNVFVLDGSNNPSIEIFRGNKYIFDVSDSSVSGHPLAFKDGSGNSWTSGVTTSGTAGTSGATVTFEVPSNAPNSMRYYCTVHGNAMGNTISVSDSNISLVAASIDDINTVAANNTNINTVATADTNISTVASSISTINSVASNETNINAVNSNSSNINAVAGAATNINTVASNLTDVNNFADTYFISATAPSSPTLGDLWFDTTTNTMKVYSSGGFINAGSAVNGTSERFKYTATAAQTTFSGDDDNLNSLVYDAGFVDCYLNGIRLVNGTDFTATSGTSIVLTIGAAANDILDIVTFGTFELSNFSINDANDVSTGGITDGQVLAYNASSSAFQPLASIPNSYLANSSITINGSAVSLGGTVSVGTVWNSESSSFNATSGNAYFVDTTSGAVTATLPSSASIGDEIRFLDVAGTFDTNNLTVGRNGHNIQGSASDLTVNTERAGFALVYYNATQGWLIKDK